MDLSNWMIFYVGHGRNCYPLKVAHYSFVLPEFKYLLIFIRIHAITETVVFFFQQIVDASYSLKIRNFAAMWITNHSVHGGRFRSVYNIFYQFISSIDQLQSWHKILILHIYIWTRFWTTILYHAGLLGNLQPDSWDGSSRSVEMLHHRRPTKPATECTDINLRPQPLFFPELPYVISSGRGQCSAYSTTCASCRSIASSRNADRSALCGALRGKIYRGSRDES